MSFAGAYRMLKKTWILLVVLLLCSAAGTALTAERPLVLEVVATPEASGARIEIRADQPLTWRSYLMPGLEKWVIDLPEATTNYSEDEAKKMRTPPLERITVRQKDVNGDLFTRIGIDFKGEVDFSLQADPIDKGKLVVLIKPARAKPPGSTAAATASAPLPLAKKPATATGSAPPATPSPAGGAAAKTITKVSITADAVSIEADGRVATPAPLLLSKPGRLVLDLPGVGSELKTVAVPANRFGIVRCRLGNSGGKLRIVFEVSGENFPDFRIRELFQGVEIRPVAEARR